MNFHDLYLLYRSGKEFGHRTIREYDLTDTEYMICVFLCGHHGVSQDDVCDTLKLEKPTISRALRSLESKGFVSIRTNQTNRRKNELSLTESGSETINRISNIYDIWLGKISDCLNSEEREAFENCCKKLTKAAKEL